MGSRLPHAEEGGAAGERRGAAAERPVGLPPLFAAYRRSLARLDDKSLALQDAVSDIALPCVVANVTTAIGFAAFSSSSLPPVRSFGMITALGVLGSAVFSLAALPAALHLLPAPRFRAAGERSVAGWWRLAKWSVRHSRALVAAAVVVGGVCSFGIARLVTDDNWLHYFPPDAEFPRAVRVVEEHLFGTGSLEAILAGDPERLLAPETLRRVDAYAKWLHARPAVDRTTSVPDFIEQVNLAFDGGREAYRIPEDPELIAQYLFSSRDPTQRSRNFSRRTAPRSASPPASSSAGRARSAS